MLLSELQTKEIIDITSGKRIGIIIDVSVDMQGRIESLVLEDKKIGRRFIGGTKGEFTIAWSNIMKIGDDIILVDVMK